ncbi:MAG: hypothetical protein C4562_01955 [Actinobacteria bacterium]|nr:MAG: hypothetical protein C4562_01955 [Actinomycetota bacterium]
MQVLFFELKVIASAFFIVLPTGFLISYFFLPERLRKYFYLLSPIFGLATISIVFQFADFFGITPGRLIIPYSIFAFISFILLIIKEDDFPRVKHCCVYLLAIVLLLIALLPMIKAGYVSVYGNCIDAHTASTLGDYLTYHNSASKVPFVNTRPNYFLLNNALVGKVRLGPMFFLAGLNGILNSNSLKTFQATSLFFYMLAIAGVYAFSSIALNFSSRVSTLAALFFGLNVLIVHGNYNGFISHLMALPFVSLGIIFGLFLLKDYSIKAAICFAIIVASLLTIYPESILYAVSIPLIWIAIKLIRERKSAYREILMTLFIVFLVIGVTSFPSIIRVAEFVKYKKSIGEFNTPQARAIAGDIRYFTPQTEALGIGVHTHGMTASNYSPVQNAIIWLSFSIAILFIVGFLIYSKGYILLTGFILYIGLAYYIFSLTFPYGYYKHIALSVYLFSAGLAGALHYFYYKKNTRIITLAAGILIFLSIAASYSLFLSNKYLLEEDKLFTPDKNIIELSHIAKVIPTNSSLFVLQEDEPKLSWVFYMLTDFRKVTVADSTRQLRLEKKSFIFLIRKDMVAKKYLQYFRRTGKVLWQNKGYLLVSKLKN